MIVRVARFKPMAADMEAAMLLNLRVRFRDALMQQGGFRGAYWARGEDGSWYSISLWDSRDEMDKGGQRANAVPLLPGQEAALIPSPAAVEVYDVIEIAQVSG